MSYPIWSYDWTGRKVTLHGKTIEIEEQLTEVLDRRMAQRQVLTLARYVEEDRPIMLKIRYQYVVFCLSIHLYLFNSIFVNNYPYI